MKKLYEILKLPKYPKGDFGIEIEAEGKKLVAVDDDHWTTVDDGSLRGRFPNERAEYVLKAPVPFKEVEAVLKSLSHSLRNSNLAFSFRTSVHVHMNMLELTIPQALNVMYTYLLLEEPLMTFCGRERKGNRFCLRLADAEGILGYYNILFKGDDKDLNILNTDGIRYASMNITALLKYGSVEFRGMKGTLDKQVLNDWVTILHYIKQYAIGMKSPVEVHEEFANIGANAFARKVLKEQFDKVMYPRLDGDIQRSFSLTIDLPYIFHTHYKEVKKRPVKTKVVEDIAVDLGLADEVFAAPPPPAPRNMRQAVANAQQVAEERALAIREARPEDVERYRNTARRLGIPEGAQTERYIVDRIVQKRRNDERNRQRQQEIAAIPRPPIRPFRIDPNVRNDWFAPQFEIRN